jgi:hypothetical protein
MYDAGIDVRQHNHSVIMEWVPRRVPTLFFLSIPHSSASLNCYPNIWYQIHRSCDIDLDAHEHYTRLQKKFGAMEPNVKLLMEEMLKQVREEIQVMRVEMKEGFVVHESFVNNRIAEFTVAEE